jgi:hypothetical protein
MPVASHQSTHAAMIESYIIMTSSTAAEVENSATDRPNVADNESIPANWL